MWEGDAVRPKLPTVLLDPSWLAAALASYEADEPHIGSVASDYYPPIDPDEWDAYLKEAHMGDCTDQPCPCAKCTADEARYKAKWLIEQASRWME